MVKKILLISPPFYKILGVYNRYFPFGIVQLATVLREKGYDAKVYDADYYADPETIDYSQLPSRYPAYLKSLKKDDATWLEVVRNIKRWKPDIVGISVYTTFAASAFKLAGLVKSSIRGCKVVIGGPHATVRAEEILKICKDVDYVVRGEAEDTIVELVEYLGEKRSFEIEKINGVSFRMGGKIVHNRDRSLPKDLDAFPIPDRSLLLNEDKLTSEDMGLIMTSRGCPYRCTYCASTKGIRYRSIDNVLEEILMVKEKYGTTQFTFKDDSFTVSRERVADLCNKLIDQRIRIKWECNTRVNLVDEELLLLMKRAGCNFIKVGVESGSDEMLKTMHKMITLDQVKVAAKLFKKVGIHWTGYFMMGVVGETEEDVWKTVKFLREVKPNLGVIAVYEPFPGTAMFDEGVKKGLLKEKMSLKDFYEIFPSNYYKIDPAIQNDKISPKDFCRLEREVNDAFHHYNKKLGNIISMGGSKIGVYLKDSRVFFEDVKKLFSY